MLHRKPNLPVVAFGVLFLAVTGFFTYCINHSIRCQRDAATEFQPVGATVVKSRVTSHTSGTGGTRSTSYSPEIEYRYQVQGREFESSRYWYTGEGFNTHQAADAVVSQFPVGESVVAYYDAANPQESVLNNSPPPVTSLLGFISLFWLIGLLILGVGIYGRRQATDARVTSPEKPDQRLEELETSALGA